MGMHLWRRLWTMIHDQLTNNPNIPSLIERQSRQCLHLKQVKLYRKRNREPLRVPSKVLKLIKHRKLRTKLNVMLKKVFHHLFYSVLQPITNCGLSRLLVGRSHFPPIFFGKKFQRESCWTSRITHGFWETTWFLIVTINESLDKWFSTRFVCSRIETSQNETLDETNLSWTNETRLTKRDSFGKRWLPVHV